MQRLAKPLRNVPWVPKRRGALRAIQNTMERKFFAKWGLRVPVQRNMSQNGSNYEDKLCVHCSCIAGARRKECQNRMKLAMMKKNSKKMRRALSSFCKNWKSSHRKEGSFQNCLLPIRLYRMENGCASSESLCWGNMRTLK